LEWVSGKQKWLAQRWVGPREMGEGIPDSGSGKHQSDAESVEGDGFGISNLDGRTCGYSVGYVRARILQTCE